MKPIILIFLITACLLSSCVTSTPPPAPEANQEIHRRVACIGDGITSGYGLQNSFWDSYPSQLQRLLGGQWQVKNFGIPNASVLLSGEHPYRQQQAYLDALAFNPDIVVIMLGSADTSAELWTHKDYFISDFKEMIVELQELKSHPQIFLSYPSPIYYPDWEIKASDELIKNGVIPKIDEVARDFNLPVIDIYKPLQNKAELFPDAVHPNTVGARIMAATVYSSIVRTQFLPAAGKGISPIENIKEHREMTDRPQRLISSSFGR